MGITTETFVIPGMVSLYEEQKVRIKRGYTISEWRSLDPMERATEVAMDRIDQMLEYIKGDKEQAMIKHNTRKK